MTESYSITCHNSTFQCYLFTMHPTWTTTTYTAGTRRGLPLNHLIRFNTFLVEKMWKVKYSVQNDITKYTVNWYRILCLSITAPNSKCMVNDSLIISKYFIILHIFHQLISLLSIYNYLALCRMNTESQTINYRWKAEETECKN